MIHERPRTSNTIRKVNYFFLDGVDVVSRSYCPSYRLSTELSTSLDGQRSEKMGPQNKWVYFWICSIVSSLEVSTRLQTKLQFMRYGKTKKPLFEEKNIFKTKNPSMLAPSSCQNKFPACHQEVFFDLWPKQHEGPKGLLPGAEIFASKAVVSQELLQWHEIIWWLEISQICGTNSVPKPGLLTKTNILKQI